MCYLLKAPGKVFLLGEYLVLNFSSAFLFSTQPYFEFYIQKGSGRVKGIHPQSPAGLWILKHKKDFLGFDCQFIDPYGKNGGFGASSSQFLFVCFWTWWRRKKGFPKIWDLWDFYQKTIRVQGDGDQARNWEVFQKIKSDEDSKNKVKKRRIFRLKASGADVITQFKGGLLEISLFPFFYRNHFWPFKDKDLIVASTETKLKTYKHLRSLKRLNFSSLKSPFEMALKGFREHSWAQWTCGVNLFYKKLLLLSLVSQRTQNYVKEISQWEGVQALKGSGAMGEDLLIIFCEKSKKNLLKEKLKRLGLRPKATLDDLSTHGLTIEKLNSFKTFNKTNGSLIS